MLIDVALQGIRDFFKGLTRGADAEPYGGYWRDIHPVAQVWRLRDRLGLGKGAEATFNWNGSQGSILPTSADGAAWALRDSQLLSIADTGLIALCGVSRSSDQVGGGYPTESIGVGGFVINDKVGGHAWGLYSDLQHEAAAIWTAGLEVAAKNKGANVTTAPYGWAWAGVYGAWFAAGGDAAYGGAPANPSAAAIAILNNASTWTVGIAVKNGALTMVNGLGTFAALPANVELRWDKPDNTPAGRIYSSMTAAGVQHRLVFSDYGAQVTGPNGETVVNITHVAGPNSVILQNSATAPMLGAWGPSADVDLRIQPKGAGRVRFGAHQPITAETGVTGFIEIKDASGVLRKLAVIS